MQPSVSPGGNPPVDNAEASRIRAVYATYDRTESNQRKRDLSNPGNVLIAEERRRRFIEALAHVRGPISDCRVLDVGCGRGDYLQLLCQHGADPHKMYGIDLLPDRVEEVRARYPEFHVECGSAEQLPYEDASFDVVLCCTMFSSVLDDAIATRIAGSIARVLRPGGAVICYDFRYPSPTNPNVRPIRAKHLRAFFPDFHLRISSLTLLPPLARRLGPATSLLYPVLMTLPPLRSHLLTVLTKPGTDRDRG